MEGEFICGVEGGEGKGEGEQQVLTELPQDLKKCIFAKLPLQSISSSRLVCKEWNYILSSHSFVSSLPKNDPWLLLCAKEYCMAYCFSTKKWRTISFSFLPTRRGRIHSLQIFSSAELGLLLLESWCRFYYICNPLTKTYTKIEIDLLWRVIGIVQGRSSDEPYLVAKSGQSYNDKKFSLEVYHFFQDSWRIKFEFSEKAGLGVDPYTIFSCNGVLFFKAKYPVTIVGYNIKGAFIKPVRIAPLPRHILEDDDVYSLLMGAYGLSVLLVGMNKDPLKGMIIWELFQDDKDEFLWQWREFATNPPISLPRYFDIDDGKSFFETDYGEFVVVGDYLCFVRRNGKYVEGVAYNLKEGFWQCLPQCGDVEYSMVSSFQPNLIVNRW